MISKAFFLVSLVLFLGGCFSAEQKKERTAVSMYDVNSDSLPIARNPVEAVRQLREGNARYAHQENRWLQFPHAPAGSTRPFVLVVNAGVGNVVPEKVFDLPRGSVPLVNWNQESTDWKMLAAGISSGIKVVLVLLPYEDADWPELATTSIAGTKTSQAMQTICRQLQQGSRALSKAVAQERCQLIGAVLHPATQRLLFLPSSN